MSIMQTEKTITKADTVSNGWTFGAIEQEDPPDTPPLSAWRRIYLGYVLLALTIIYIFNQADRFLLSVLSGNMAASLNYGLRSCYPRGDVGSNTDVCLSQSNRTTCLEVWDDDGNGSCVWHHMGLGHEFDLLTGPAFVIPYTVAGVVLGLAADLYNRQNLLMACFILWSLVTVVTGVVTSFWQLVLLRILLGMAEGGCTPFAVSMIGDYFPQSHRATALGIYNIGVYFGYSLGFLLGTQVNVVDFIEGWRWTYYVAGSVGILLGVLFVATVREPERQQQVNTTKTDARISKLLGGKDVTWYRKLGILLKSFATPSLVIVCVAGSVRNAGAYIWGYYAYYYFFSVGEAPRTVGIYLTWVPIVGGICSAAVGGVVADKLTVRLGSRARLAVIGASLMLASPFAILTFCLDAPYAYYTMIPTYIFGEAWVGITLAVLIELLPPPIRSSGVAFYFFIISLLGGLGPMVVTPICTFFTHRGLAHANALGYTLGLLFPGCYIISAIVFLLAICVVNRDIDRVKKAAYETIN